jgi:DNA-directed RNA polymerase specialized sigma54-like protein
VLVLVNAGWRRMLETRKTNKAIVPTITDQAWQLGRRVVRKYRSESAILKTKAILVVQLREGPA